MKRTLPIVFASMLACLGAQAGTTGLTVVVTPEDGARFDLRCRVDHVDGTVETIERSDDRPVRLELSGAVAARCTLAQSTAGSVRIEAVGLDGNRSSVATSGAGSQISLSLR
jgi:hypothetical protein